MNHWQLLNELPKYSQWPLRLLGLEQCEQRKKDAAEITREYEVEKWGELWRRVCAAGRDVTLGEIDQWQCGEVDGSLCWHNNQLELLSSRESAGIQLEIFRDHLCRYLPSTALVELGAGYGRVILSLAQAGLLSDVALIAAEYTPSGINLIRHLAASHKIPISVGSCDFSTAPITSMAYPEGCTIFTSFSTPYVRSYTTEFVRQIASHKPSIVVHFEPFYEHCDATTLLGAMQKRYIEINDYNRNLLTVLREAESSGLIDIVVDQPQVFGSNPLLPFSIVAWQPSQAGVNT